MMRAGAAAVLVALAACDSPSAPDIPQPLVLKGITQPGFSGYDTPQRLVIRTQADWEAAWATIWRLTVYVPALPAVDFARDVVLIAAAGAKPPLHFIAIEAASATRDSATVTVRSYSPVAGCVTTPVITTPADVVQMPRRDHITFVEEAVVRPC